MKDLLPSLLRGFFDAPAFEVKPLRLAPRPTRFPAAPRYQPELPGLPGQEALPL
jgi:hypothetical protein